MSQQTEEKLDILTKHRRLLTRVFVGLYITATILLVGLTVLLSIPDSNAGNSQFATAGMSVEPQTESVQEDEALSLPPSEPVLLTVPSIDLVARFESPLDLNDDGTVQVPEGFERVARYKHTPTPGEMGPSVILGHVDSFRGPAVFYSLRQVRKGDLIEVERRDGIVVTFEVTDTEVVEQGNFPGAKVYGSIPYAGIRLVTCTGVYDRTVRRYSHNLIVYGELKEIAVSVDSIKLIEG